MTKHEDTQTSENARATDSSIGSELTRHSSANVPLGVVYFVRSGDGIKIGHANNFKDRIRTLQTAHEKPLDVLAVIPGLNEYETHQRFAHLRTRGEWFRAEQELLDFIESAKMAHGEIIFEKLPKIQKPAPTEQQKHLAAMLLAYERADPSMKETVGFTLRRNFANMFPATN